MFSMKLKRPKLVDIKIMNNSSKILMVAKS